MSPLIMIQTAAIFTISLYSTPVYCLDFQIQPLLRAAAVSVSIVLRVISITCKTSTLPDIYKQIRFEIVRI
jgi:hypothetical protein